MDITSHFDSILNVDKICARLLHQMRNDMNGMDFNVLVSSSALQSSYLETTDFGGLFYKGIIFDCKVLVVNNDKPLVAFEAVEGDKVVKSVCAVEI